MSYAWWLYRFLGVSIFLNYKVLPTGRKSEITLSSAGVPVMHIGHDMFVDILSHQLAELLVAVVVVGRVVRLVPRRIAKGMTFTVHLRRILRPLSTMRD